MDFIMIPLILGIVTLGIYKLFELFACRRERMAIIEKLGEKITAADLTGKLILPTYSHSQPSFSALKGGLLMLGIGLGLLMGFFLCAYAIPSYCVPGQYSAWDIKPIAGVIYGSCVLIFGGLGLLIAFLIETIISKNKKE